MGQEQSTPEQDPATPEQLSSLLAHRFAEKCFSHLELTHFKDVFRSLADEQDGIQYWREETLGRYLALPDAFGVRPVMFQMTSYLGAFPFPSLAPAILTREALVKVVVIMTERYSKVLKRGTKDRNKLLFRSLAVFDRRSSSRRMSHPAEKIDELRRDKESAPEQAVASPQPYVQGFSIDQPAEDDEDDDDDELALAALDALDDIAVYTHVEQASRTKMLQAQIPVDNFRRLLLYLLTIATLESQENLSQIAAYLAESRLESLKRIADSILWTFAPEDNPGISFPAYRRIISNSLPYLFDGFNPLFEHFLFSKNLDLTKHKAAAPSSPPPSTPRTPRTPVAPPKPKEPLLESEGDILDLVTLGQLSFFIKSSEMFHRLRLLYSGAAAGFSIGSFSQKVLNWRAPTILLVSGSRLSAEPASSRERTFAESLPPKRFPDGSSGNVHLESDESPTRLVFGAYLNPPWKQTHKEAIGDEKTILFQLEPLHDVFRASSLNHDYATLGKEGIGIGCPPARKMVAGLADSHRVSLGAVSLWLDAGLEFGVFTHNSAGGGAFSTSRAGRGDWQERFEVDSLEVWGCGGDEEAERQREAWKWEEREAEARRGVKLGRDRDADYALLEMAGLVGGHGNSGGSMA